MSRAPNDGLVVAIIPARGGSKGLPRKNLLPVAGVPLVGRAVASARRAAGVDRVYVSTDDAEIAAVSRAAGADVIDRPSALAGDTAASESALLHAMDEIEGAGNAIRAVAFLQATSPFIPPDALDEAVAMVTAGDYDAVFSAYETYGFLWARAADGAAIAVNHSADRRPRRQDREPHFMETGAFYVLRAEGFRRAGHRFFGRVGFVEVSESSAIEIDEPSQYAVAGALAHLVGDPERIDVDAVVTDFDGVHTDDSAYVDADGRETVRVSRSDGMGVSLLLRRGIPFLILSTETNGVVAARAAKLGVAVMQGIDDKAAALRDWAVREKLDLARVAYLGNDVNDLPAMALVGWPAAPADAHPMVQDAARIVLRRPGGHGAVRELAEFILSSSG